MLKTLKYSYLILLSCLSLVLISSCSKDDEPDYTPPSTNSFMAPTGLSGTAVSDGVLLSWNAVDGAEFYVVDRSSSIDGVLISLGYIGENGHIYNTSVIDTKPLDGDNYYFIRACKDLQGNNYITSYNSAPIYVHYTRNNNSGGGNGGGGNSGGNDYNPGGNSGNGDNGGNGGSGGSTVQRPSAPTGVRVSNEGNNYIPNVIVRWNSVSNATNYYVYKSSSAVGRYTKIGETSYAEYGFCDTNAPTDGSSAFYKVKAVNSAGESEYSDYAKYTATSNEEAFAPAYTYGNCTASGNQITLRWTNSTGHGYGKATEVVLRVWNPYAEEWQDTQVSASATSASFNYSTKIDNEGYVKAGIIVKNAQGSYTAGAKVYDARSNKWLN